MSVLNTSPLSSGYGGAYPPGQSVPYYGPGYYPQHSQGYLQMSHMTKQERFPLIFDRVKELRPDAKRVLSFGCSTGEEVFALAKRFPEAEIVGVDIDHYSIQRGRQNNQEKDRIYFHTDPGATGRYDVITCLMVLFQMDSPIRFKPWDDILFTLNKHANPGCVLAMYTSEYNFLQSSAAHNFDVIRDWTRKHNRNGKDYFCGYYRKVRDEMLNRVEAPAEEPKKEEIPTVWPTNKQAYEPVYEHVYGNEVLV